MFCREYFLHPHVSSKQPGDLHEEEDRLGGSQRPGHPPGHPGHSQDPAQGGPAAQGDVPPARRQGGRGGGHAAGLGGD